ncbi:hypothetical protein WN943_005993 [Citrus x changshan-huyou]
MLDLNSCNQRNTTQVATSSAAAAAATSSAAAGSQVSSTGKRETIGAFETGAVGAFELGQPLHPLYGAFGAAVTPQRSCSTPYTVCLRLRHPLRRVWGMVRLIWGRYSTPYRVDDAAVEETWDPGAVD